MSNESSIFFNIISLTWLGPVIKMAAGISPVDVHGVLGLDCPTQIRKIILPSALPHVFAGPRLSLNAGRRVLIVAEILKQDPGHENSSGMSFQTAVPTHWAESWRLCLRLVLSVSGLIASCGHSSMPFLSAKHFNRRPDMSAIELNIAAQERHTAACAAQ